MSDWNDVLIELHDRFDALEKEIRKASAEMSAIIREYVDGQKDEPQTSCKTCRYGEVDEGYVRCAYYSKSAEQDEPQMDWYWRCPKCDHIVPNLYDECVWCLEPKPKDEPQTCSVSGRPYSECADCEHFRCTADEPQKIMEKCYSCKWWNYSYGCSNKKGICEFEPLKGEQSGKE